MPKRSSAPSSSGAPPGLDVYLLPAVVGGGLGDIGEVLDAGRYLAAAGFALRLYRAGSRPLPPSVDGPWDWPPISVSNELRPTADRALTVTPVFGLSAAPARRGAYGAPGPWTEETAAIEARYGAHRTLHVSLEEFARTYPSARENQERYREGGVAYDLVRASTRGPTGEAARAEWRGAFRRFRALDRPNVLHLLGTFDADPAFRREFPEFVQVGPLWPGLPAPPELRPPSRSVLWYASPSSSASILAGVLDGARGIDPPVPLSIRSPRPLPLPPSNGVRVELLSPMPSRLWRKRFVTAGLRIVTGSRSLLEAIELGDPFLYFNGAMYPHGRARRHRPEKVQGLLRLLARLGTPRPLRRDLDAFSRGQRVADVVRRAVNDPAWWAGFPSPSRLRAATPEALDVVLVRVAREFSRGEVGSPVLVARERSGNLARPAPRRSKV